VIVQLDGGKIIINYDEKDGLILTGDAEFCFDGTLPF
jgi:diaminopimelate epimerase